MPRYPTDPSNPLQADMPNEQDNLDQWRAQMLPFASHLGLRLVRMDDGESEMHYTALPEHLNSFGVTHGGATMTLLDVTMAAAARSVEPEMGAVTIEMKTSFFQPARGPLVARATLLHRTRFTAFVEARLFDARNRLCSQATGTFRYVPHQVPTTPAPATPAPAATGSDAGTSAP